MQDDDVVNLILVKGILAGVILSFARKPHTTTDSTHLQPYTADEAMDIVDNMFARYEKEAKERAGQ